MPKTTSPLPPFAPRSRGNFHLTDGRLSSSADNPERNNRRGVFLDLTIEESEELRRMALAVRPKGKVPSRPNVLREALRIYRLVLIRQGKLPTTP